MKLTKSLLLLIVAIIAGSNASETFSNFNITNSATDSKCPSTSPSEIAINACSSVCESNIKITPVTGSSNKFTFNTFTDAKCETTSTPTEFTCAADGKTAVAIDKTTYSVICVPDKQDSSDKSDSSDSTKIGASVALLALVLISLLGL
ncbi:hypothetical protein ACTA71_002279 [Dictyostelium dimigraforme]